MPKKQPEQRKTREDWIAAARAALISGGVDQVKVDRLARKMRITRGSFYWFFKSREELLEALLKDWEVTNTQPLLNAIATLPKKDGTAAMNALIEFWLEEKDFSPAYDSAVRDWARGSEEVEKTVHRIDNIRIDAIKQIFLDLGYPDEEAFIRARVTYFHQVGYYALRIRESMATRLKLLPLYTKVLVG